MGSAQETDAAEADTEQWENVDAADVAMVVSSKYRQQVMDSLADGAATPTAIAEEQPAEIAHVSRALNTLRDNGIVNLIVPEETMKGRLYQLSDKGRVMLDEADEVIQRNSQGDA